MDKVPTHGRQRAAAEPERYPALPVARIGGAVVFGVGNVELTRGTTECRSRLSDRSLAGQGENRHARASRASS